MSINWEKNPDYPLSFATCRECGHQGLIKLAWDLHGHLCLDAKPCLARMVRQHSLSSIHGDDTVVQVDTLEEFMEEVDANDKRLFEALDRTAIKPEKTVFITENGLQHFVCEKCNVSWSRPSTRGRPPKICPDCRG